MIKRIWGNPLAAPMSNIQNIPKAVLENILASFLSNSELIITSSVNRQSRAWTKLERQKRALDKLWPAVIVDGNQNKAEAIIKSDPEFFITKKASSGMTVFQAALCAGDVEMCEMMKPYFYQLEDGQAELDNQFYDIFPGGLESHTRTQKENTFDFSVILTAIQGANQNDLTQALSKDFGADTPLNQALVTFRHAFDTKSQLEKIFNPQHLLEALKCYEEAFDTLGPDWDKRDLLWRQVIGYTQRHLPACYAQAFAQGVYGIVENGEPLKRSFDFRFGGGSIFPVVAGGGLGFDFAGGLGRSA